MYFVTCLQMPEEQAFCILVKLMYDYGLRDLYKDGFENLSMRLYQLNRLMQVCIEIIRAFLNFSEVFYFTSLTGMMMFTFVLCIYESMTFSAIKFFFFFSHLSTGAIAPVMGPFLSKGRGVTHVCIAVVSHIIHCPISTLLCFSHHWCVPSSGCGYTVSSGCCITEGKVVLSCNVDVRKNNLWWIVLLFMTPKGVL